MSCAREAPGLEAVRRRWGDRVRFVVVSLAQDPARTRQFAARYGFSEPLAVTSGNLLAVLGSGELPSTYWLDGQGRVVASIHGAAPEAVLEAETAAIAR
jgi:hypothetical protein